jgi:asparagine synthase (glutamine-hydrolysing)
MCGIAGIYHFNKERVVNRALLKKMTDIIRHRGPDSEGVYCHNNVGLGHRRLSIIDLKTGDQPMLSDDRKKVIVYNGEIYNYLELRDELKQHGYHFKTNSDTEVILKAYELWGYECQNKFNGMWAFAIWDQSKQQLFLSRDRIGEKPLHYSVYDNSVTFGSEMKSLFTYGIPREMDFDLLELYLVLTNIPEPYTFYKDIRKLRAGHFILVKNGIVKEHKYWDLPEIDESNMKKNKKEIYKEFDYLLKDAVKIRMRADVPFGAFLSGGLDSSAIVSIMSKISPHAINTFTIGFDDKAFDESILAQEVADRFHTLHNRGTIHSEEFEEILRRTAFHYDEPFGDSSAIPTGYVSKYAAAKVKMVLTGDGGDEALSGYSSYLGLKISSLINKVPPPIQKAYLVINKIIADSSANRFRYKLNKIDDVIRTAGLDFNNRVAQKTVYTSFANIKKLTNGIPHVVRIEEYLSDFIGKTSYKDAFYKMMYYHYKHSLPNDYLVKVDRMSMANSLETRLPFLDYRIIEFMAHVDKNVKLQGWERKSVLRNTIGKTLPDSILNAPKRGFGVPLREWFKDDSFNNLISSNLVSAKELLSSSGIDSILKENKSGMRDNGNFIWSLIVLDRIISQ